MTACRAPKLTEAELARPVLAWLRERRWEVYQEVAGPAGIADIVATQDARAAVVELKTSLSFEVVAQGRRWLPWAHWSWIAVPKEKGSDISAGRWLAYRVCADMGIGVLVVKQPSESDRRVMALAASRPESELDPESDAWLSKYVEQVQPAALQRRANVAKLVGLLKPEHQTYAPAGGRHGKHWSPFQATCREVRRFLEKQGGSAELGAVVKGIEHHYSGDSAARSSLVTWIEKGSVEGVEVDRSEKRIRLRLAPLG